MFSNFKISVPVVCFTLLLAFLIFSFLSLFWTGQSGQAKELNIAYGAGFHEITSQLVSMGIIRSEIAFEVYALATKSAFHFKPGRYFLTKDISVSKLVGILKNGPQEVSVIIFPGMTLKEIDGELSSLSIIRPGELITFNAEILKQKYPWFPGGSLEGFLFPDTYIFFTGSDANSVVERFLGNFEIKALTFFKNYNNISRIINLASILEKEVPDYKDRQIVAGISIKRLADGMPVQADATLLYFKCSAGFSNCPGLGQSDYKIDSPYNTYLRVGLPETAISNPSLSAIKAALNPVESDYWYYLSDPKTKKTIFSQTLDEQNENRAKYLN